MNGQMNRYKNSLKNTPKPVMPSQLKKVKIDLKGLMEYAREKNVSPAELTEKDKSKYIS